MRGLDTNSLQPTPRVLSSDSYAIHRELDELAKRDGISLDRAQLEIISSHIEDVVDYAELMGPKSSQLLQPLRSVVRSFHRFLLHLAVLFFSNPLGPIIDCTNHFYGAIAYIAIYLTLFTFQALLVVSNALGLEKIGIWVSKHYAEGYGVTSWADIKMFEKKADTIQASRSDLSRKLEDDKPLHPEPQYIELNFSLEVAKSILLMSAIIYERDQVSVRNAFQHGQVHQECKAPHESAKNNTNGIDGALIDPEVHDGGNHELKILQVTNDLWESERKIHNAAKEWGCKFISIADFQKAKNPFVGAFYDLDSGPCPFIVVVFKGTSPEAISEWIVDATFNLECSSDKLGAGFAHQGFYTSLFPSSSVKQKPSPYLRIINAITKVADKWRQSPRGKANPEVRMNLFVGGHSLGAGIASLFYARLLESPEDLGEHITLRDAYCFGTPRACDSILASRFEYNLSKPKNFRRTMWRIRNKSASDKWGDIITYCPPGMADARGSRSAFRVASFLSYAAIGVPVDLQPTGESPFCKFTSIPCGYKLNLNYILQKTQPSRSDLDHRMDYLNPTPKPIVDPIFLFNWFFKTFLPILHDHFPGSYYESLDKIDPLKEKETKNKSILAFNASYISFLKNKVRSLNLKNHIY